ncbi:MAG: amphi-Trp domain-containing protein [Actinobacteria bacterium]|nr:amphi-Trp domain-containing protein [Actinomycetota bacterium]
MVGGEKPQRDVEKNYPADQFVEKLRRLADSIERGEKFRIQVAGERITIPPSAVISIEHERGGSEEELEFQLKWSIEQGEDDSEVDEEPEADDEPEE